MANWRQMTADDVAATLSQREVDAYQRSGGSNTDPLATLIARTTARVRLSVRTNGRVRMSPDPSLLPVSLVSAACDYMVFDILKRLDVEVGEDRRRARQQAIDLFDRVERGEVTPEGWDEPETAETGHSAAQLVGVAPNRVTARGLQGF